MRSFTLSLATGEYLDRLGAMYHAPARERGEPDDDYRRRVVRHVRLRLDADRVTAAFALAERVARLNPDAGEIGAGMLAQLVADARAIVAD